MVTYKRGERVYYIGHGIGLDRAEVVRYWRLVGLVKVQTPNVRLGILSNE